MKPKYILCMLALLCAVVQGAKAQTNWGEVYAMTQTTTADWTQLTEGSTTGQTIGTAGATTYYYAGSDLTFTNSTDCGSGLTIQGTVYLYVPEGVTVTCKGTSGRKNTIGSGAGIELTEGNTLYLIGTGTVNAEGGLASGGRTGNDGGDAGWDGNNYWSGTGGRGGNGGGGAGAGIGTRGGDGGMGADGSASVVSKWDHAGGGSGVAGLAGATAGAMGKLYVAQSFIHLTATGGSAGWMYGSGNAGRAGKSILDDDETYNYCAAGGGGGGGGGYGGAAAGIGTGGPGGGGSGGGASGNLEWCNSGYYVVRAPGGKGGQNGDGSWAADGEESILNYENLNNGKAISNGSGWSNNDNYISSQAVGTGGSGGAAGAASISVNSQVISIVTSETTTMTSGYYYVLGDVTVTERITVNGNVTLSLDKDATLNAPKGIELAEGNSLTINGPGALTIDDVADSKSGIGAMALGALTINGGQLTITGGNGAPGIGSDTGAGSGTLTLGWNAVTDFIACSSYAVASITFAPGKKFILDGSAALATPDNISGKKLVPFDDYVTSESTTLTTGRYLVNANLTIPTRITISGDVVLNLGEGTTLNAKKGIELSEGNSLTINGSGALTIDDVANSKSGIGAAAVGTLTINGGTITVSGGRYGAALGGDCDNNVGGSITINGGIVHATGGENAAAIGGGKDTKDGKYGVCGVIAIHGGQVTAIGGTGAPGVGPGYEQDDMVGYSSGTLTLGWTTSDDFISISGLKNNRNSTLESITFVPGKMFSLDGTTPVTIPDDISGKLVPFLNNQCGDGLAWNMSDTDGNGSLETLDIFLDGSGTGAMTDYGEGDAAAPWVKYYGSDITAVNISGGVTHVGNNAFRGCSNLSRINLLNGDENLIASLGEGALQNCNALTTITVTKPVLYMKYVAADQWSAFSSKLRLTLGHDYFFEVGGSTNEAYYKIATADDLRRLAEAVNAGNGALTHQQQFCQTADIDLAGADFPGIGLRNGNESFRGTYDGGGHTISGLNVSTSHDCAGLFGHVSNGAKLRNINLVQPSVTTTADTDDPIRVGTVAGYASSAEMENCHVLQPTLSATGSGTKRIGAIVGEISGTGNRFVNCFYNRAGNLEGIGANLGTENIIDNIVPVYSIGIDDASVALPDNLYYDPQGDVNSRYIYRHLGFTLGGTIYLRDQLQFTPTVKVTDPGVSGYATRLMFDGQVIEPDEGATSPAQVTICADYDGKTLSAGVRGSGKQEVTYVDAHGQQHTTQATLLDGYEPIVKVEDLYMAEGINLAAGTYFVGIDLDYTDIPIYLKGDITLILGNGRTMRFGTDSHPHQNSAINHHSHNLTIYGQSLDAATAGTLSYVGSYYMAILVEEYTQHSGNVIIRNSSPDEYSARCIDAAESFTLNGGTLSATIDTDNSTAINSSNDITINGGQLTASASGTSNCYGLLAVYGSITLSWTNPDDFICASNFHSGYKGISFVPGKMFSLDDDMTPIATPDNIGGKKLVPFLDNQCGNGIVWYMTDTDGNGSLETLNILHDGSGTGAMADYSEDDAATAPWITYYGSDITAVNISDGVTHVGNNAFRGLTGIVEVTLGASVTSIGTGAFANCSNLSRINLLNGDENLIVGLDEGALQDCNALTAITVTKPVLYMKYAAADQWKGFSSKLRLTLGYDYLFEGGGSTNNAYYKIATADDLRRLAEAVNAGNGALTHQQKFCQTADIDLAGADFPGIGLCSDNESFQGNYDGGEHTISGLSVSSSHDCVGLFGYVSNSASLRNFYLVQPTVTTTAHTADPIRVGAVAGFVSSAFIENCHVIRPTLSATGSGTKYIGAIVGEISGRVNSLVNCFYNRAGDLGGIGVNHGLACTIENIVPVYGFVIDNASVELPNNLYTFPNGDWYLRYIKKDLGFNLKGTFYLRDQLQFKPTVKVTDPGIRGYATRLMFDGQVLEPDEGATSLTQVTITVSADIDGKTLSVGSRSNGQPQEVTYVDAHGLQHTTQATLLDGYEPIVKREGAAFDYISLAAGTYFVGIDLDYTGVPIYPNGDITLILGNGRTMRFGRNSNPTTCPAINDYASNLTIYGQSLDADIAGTLRYVGENSEAIHVGKYTQHSGNVILHSSRSSGMGHCLEAWNFNLNGGTLRSTNNADEGCAINANTIAINGGQLTANSTGKELCFGLYAGGSNGITLGWTHPDDFICASSYFVEKGTIATAHVPATDNYQHFTLDDGTTLISGTLDAATLAGSTLKPTWVGQGTEADPYLISFTSELDLLSARVSGAHGQTHRDDGYLGCYFRLTNDIAYPYTTRWDDATSTENNFEPIGREYAFRFRGDFDGGGHIVSGIRLYISPGEYGTEGGNVGIFGTTGKESYIHDLTIADANITGLEDVGGIVGHNRGTITRCHAANNFLLRADENGCCCFGGITGSCPENSVVTHCTSAVTIAVSDRGRVYQVGGIVGDNVGATMTDNLVFGATIPAAITSSLPNSHGAITGRPYETNLANNYYSASNVAGIPNAIGIGSGPIDSSYEENCDLPENDGIVPLLRDQADNTAAIEHVSALTTAGAGGTALDLGWGAGRFPFQLAGRTLYKDGSWNTLCLPFAVAIEDSPLEDATIMMLDNSTASSTGFDAATGTLHLDFVEATSIEPGVAYLVKWDRATDYVDDDAHNIVNPVFYGAAVSAEAPAGKRTESADGKVAFTGTYAALAYDKDTPGVLFLGADNKLYYPKSGASIGAFRAMFSLNGITAGEPKDGEQGIKAFALDFGNENSTLVSLPSEMEEADAWYDLSGRRLEGKPSQRGIYVNQGRKVVIK